MRTHQGEEVRCCLAQAKINGLPSPQEYLTLHILANGPSLAEVDLPTLSSVATLGMNAAYRHWERIGWFPTYYACLDDVVAESHAGAIAEMLRAKVFHSAFLAGSFFDAYPEFRSSRDILNLDQVSNSWFTQRGRIRGLRQVYHPAFDSCYPFITTGSWAIRWGAFMGYRDLLLYGFDLEYEPELPGVSTVQGLRVRVDETPNENPNYFFDDYQRAGDEFQVANPTHIHPHLHRDSMLALLHDLSLRDVGVNMTNALPHSGLSCITAIPSLSDIKEVTRA